MLGVTSKAISDLLFTKKLYIMNVKTTDLKRRTFFKGKNANFFVFLCVLSFMGLTNLSSQILKVPSNTPGRTASYVAGHMNGDISAFSQIEAETFDSMAVYVAAETCGEGGENIGWIENGDYIVFTNVNFGSGASKFEARVASGSAGGSIEVRLGSPTGKLVGTCTVTDTGGWQAYATTTCAISGASGVNNLYLVFKGDMGYLFNINWITFIAGPSGLNKTSMANNIKIYPNPVSSILNINFTDDVKNREVNIFNGIGQVVYCNKAENRSTQIDIKSLNLKGLITIQVISGNETSICKVVAN